MKNYINKNNIVYSYDEDIPKEILDVKIKDLGLVTISDEDLVILRLPTLEQVKTKKLTEIETAYNNEISANINYMNTEFQADKNSRELIVATLSGGSLPDGFFWQDLNDDRIPMTYAELQGLAAAILDRGQLAFIKLQDLKVLVNRADITIEELGLIVW